MTVVNHVGHCVTDLERSVRFYVEALGFEEQRRLVPDDGPTSKLLRVPEPVNLTAVYLTMGAFVLELLHFDRDGNEPKRGRDFTEPGLTHLSLNVNDVAATCGRVMELGGEVLDDTNLGVAVLVRDPDGQLIELLAAR